MTTSEIHALTVECLPCPTCGASPRQGCRIVGGPRRGQALSEPHDARKRPLVDVYRAGVETGRRETVRQIQDRAAERAERRRGAGGSHETQGTAGEGEG